MTTMKEVVSWWWTEKVGTGHQEHTIADVVREDFNMHHHHIRLPDRKPETPLPTTLYSLAQQLIRQDPLLYRIMVTLRPEHAWKLISYPCFLRKSLPDNEEAPNLVQLTMVMGGDNRGDVSAEAYGKEVLKGNSQWLLPGFVKVNEDLQYLEREDLGTLDNIARAHQTLEVLGTYPQKHAQAYEEAWDYFPAGAEIFNLGALSDALLGMRRWDSPTVMAEMEKVLGRPQEANEFLRQWRRLAVTKAISVFQHVKTAERKLYGTNSYFEWNQHHPGENHMP